MAEGSLVLTPWEWSPDGTRLACYGYAYHRDSGGADYAIYLVSVDGSEVTDLTSKLPELEGTTQGNPRWSPDGTRLTFDNDDGIYVVNADGSGVTKVARGAFPSWSPNGTRIAFVTGSEGGGSEIRIADVEGTGETTVTSGGGWVDPFPAWSPDGSKIAYIAWVKGEGQHLYVVNPDGTGETRLTDLRSDGMGGYSPTWSPDGSTIAVEVFQHGNWNIYLVQADGSGVRQLTDSPGDEERPTWAPDGTKIAFMGSPVASSEGENTDTFDVYVVNPDGTGVRRLTEGAGAAPGALTWQPLIVSRESPSPTPSPSPSLNAVVAATTTVGADGAVRSVVFGEGAVWVAVAGEPSEPGTVLRIHPVSDEIVATIPVDAVPGWVVGGAALTTGAGSVWVAGNVEDPTGPPVGLSAVLERIDPTTNEVAATIPLGRGSVGDVAVDESGVWVAVGDEEQGQLIRVDPSTNEVVTSVPISYEGASYQDLRQVVVDGVVLVIQPTFDNGGSAITAADAATNQMIGTEVIRVPEDLNSSIGPLVAQGGEVWAGNGYRLVRLDPRTGHPSSFVGSPWVRRPRPRHRSRCG